MNPDTAQALFSELSFILNDKWDISREPNGYRIRARAGTLDTSNILSALRDEVWRIARFISYRHFVSITNDSENSYTIVSRMESGESFEIAVETGP